MENPTEHCPLSIPYKKLASLRFPHLAKKRKREEVVLPLFIPPFVTMQGKPPPVITEELLFLSLLWLWFVPFSLFLPCVGVYGRMRKKKTLKVSLLFSLFFSWCHLSTSSEKHRRKEGRAHARWVARTQTLRIARNEFGK